METVALLASSHDAAASVSPLSRRLRLLMSASVWAPSSQDPGLPDIKLIGAHKQCAAAMEAMKLSESTEITQNKAP